VQHVEFLHNTHFEVNYHRKPAPSNLSHFIDFFWETDFNHLWADHPGGFSDLLFANTGYTYLLNLGTPFVMKVGDRKFDMRSDGFLPRQQAIECFHQAGNCLFGIKFRVSPILFIKNINFAEYRSFIFPLSYLIDPGVVERVKKAGGFTDRVAILSEHFSSMISNNASAQHQVSIVTSIMNNCDRRNDFVTPIEEYARMYKVSIRTLQRYFETCTGIGSKQALQILRIRKATEHLVNSPADFHFSTYGYYDYSHFFKHLRGFLQKDSRGNMNLHLRLLESLHNKA
jgi:hypothetical protein